MSPTSLAGALPSGAASGANPGDDNFNGILRSIGVLRSLLLDTSSNSSHGHHLPSSPAQQQQQISSETSLRDKLNEEISRRKTLESAYESLSKLQKQQSSQLDIVLQSRKELEDQLAKMEAERKSEKMSISKEYMRLRNEISILRQENNIPDSTLSPIPTGVHDEVSPRLQHQLQSEQIEHDVASKEWEDRLATLQQQLEESKARAEEAEKALALTQDELSHSKKELDIANEKVNQLSNQKVHLENQINELSTMNAKSQQEVVSLKQQLQETKQLRKEKSDLEVQLNQAEKNKNAMEKQLEQYQAELQSHTTLMQENDKLKKENESLLKTQHDVELLKEKLETSQSNMMNDDEMFRNMEHELVEARRELSKKADLSTHLQLILQEKEESYEKLHSEFLLMENELKTKEKTIVEKDEILEQLHENIMVLEQQESDMAATNAANSTIEKLREELTQIKKEKITLLQTMKTIQENHLVELATVREKSREFQGMLEDSRNKVAELEEIINKDSVGNNESQENNKKRSRE